MAKRIESPDFLVQPRTAARAQPHDKAAALRAAKAAVAKIARKPLPKTKKGARLKTAAKVVAGQKLRPLISDRAYLDSLREAPSFLTGARGTPEDPVEPMHIGNPGKNLKADDEALPELHSIHARCHREGEMKVIRELISDDTLRAAMRALARERYRFIKEGTP